MEIQTTELSVGTAKSVVNRLFLEIYGLYNQQDITTEWFNTNLDILRFSREIEIGFGHARAMVLAVLKERWDEVPREERAKHGFAFANFAKTWSGGKAYSTCEGWILTARIWLIEEYGKGKVVRIKERAENGAPILENGKPCFIDKEFIPYNVDFSKLLVLNSRVRKGEMTEKLWEMLVDDFYTVDDIRMEDSNGNDGEQYANLPYYHLEGPTLCISKNGHTVEICELFWEEYDKDPLVKEAIDTILKILRVVMDEDKIHTIERKT